MVKYIHVIMNFRLSSILVVICISVMVIQQETEAKAILDFLFDKSNYENNYQHYHHHHHTQQQPPRPVGGKERFKQICNVIRGISDCYA